MLLLTSLSELLLARIRSSNEGRALSLGRIPRCIQPQCDLRVCDLQVRDLSPQSTDTDSWIQRAVQLSSSVVSLVCRPSEVGGWKVVDLFGPSLTAVERQGPLES